MPISSNPTSPWYQEGGKHGRGFIFILTYGRSGSTLLMNLINSSPVCIIRGENNGALYALLDSFRRLRLGQIGREDSSKRQTSPWWGISEVDTEQYGTALAKLFVDAVIRPEAQHAICGFKEIRYTVEEAPDLDGYLDFLLRYFHPSKVIFNYRNLGDVTRSKWWSGKENAMEELKSTEARFHAFADPQTFFHFSYDRAMSDGLHVKQLFDFLTLPYEHSAIQAVLSERHSY